MERSSMTDAGLRAAEVVARLEKEEGRREELATQDTVRAATAGSEIRTDSAAASSSLPSSAGATPRLSDIQQSPAPAVVSSTAPPPPAQQAAFSPYSAASPEPAPPEPSYASPAKPAITTRLPQLALLSNDPSPRPAPVRGNPAATPVKSTKRLSFTSLETNKRPIKYGTGKYAGIELVPQPSDDKDDPLNWPTWKKDLNLGALLMSVALACVMKTALIPVNVQLETGFNRSYTDIAALTGGPLLFSALSGMLALVTARIWGKRPLYIAGMLSMFFGSIWNTAVGDFGQFMAARIFQGIGWGVFDSLVLGSIHDVYFEHERPLRIALHQIVSVGTTWGGPLLGGVASMNPGGFRAQFQILCAFQAISSLLVAFAAPETAYDRSFVFLNTPATGTSYYSKQMSLKPRGTIDVESVKEYLSGMKPQSYEGPEPSSNILLQAPRALVAPTTLLLFFVSFLPFSALWTVAGSLSLLFAHLPFELTPSSIGALMAGPFLLGVIAVGFFVLAPWWQQRRSLAQMNLAAVACGSVLTFASLLAVGLYVEMAMTPPEQVADSSAASAAASASETSPFMVGGVAARLSFPGLGMLLALLALGAYAVDAAVRPLVGKSTQFTSSNLGVALRNTVDMETCVGLLRSAAAGAFVVASPNLVWNFGAMRSAMVGFGTAQMFVAAAVGAVWWVWGDVVLRLDGHVMKCVDMRDFKRTGSFFDTD